MTTPPHVLYHYCSPETFLAIVQGKAIWLSSLSLSNDTSEGRLVSNLIREKANEGGMEAARVAELADYLAALEGSIDGLGFCVSEKDDLLSQWRGYAADAKGFAIGFQTTDLVRGTNGTTLSLQRVLYDRDEQEAAILPTYLELAKLINSGALDAEPGRDVHINRFNSQALEDWRAAQAGRARDFISRLTSLVLPKLYSLKNGGFAEEKEWRLVGLNPTSPDTPEEAKHFKIQYRCAGSKIVPYSVRSLDPSGGNPVIVDVVLGPGNLTPPSVVSSLLRTAGFHGAAVRPSVATYRGNG